MIGVSQFALPTISRCRQFRFPDDMFRKTESVIVNIPFHHARVACSRVADKGTFNGIYVKTPPEEHALRFTSLMQASDVSVNWSVQILALAEPILHRLKLSGQGRQAYCCGSCSFQCICPGVAAINQDVFNGSITVTPEVVALMIIYERR